MTILEEQLTAAEVRRVLLKRALAERPRSAKQRAKIEKEIKLLRADIRTARQWIAACGP